MRYRRWGDRGLTGDIGETIDRLHAVRSHQSEKNIIMENVNVTFKVGDSVIVKPGVRDPDMGPDIGGVMLGAGADPGLSHFPVLILAEAPGDSTRP